VVAAASGVLLLAATADHVDVSVAASSDDLLALAASGISIPAVSRLLVWDPARCICEPGSRLPGNSGVTCTTGTRKQPMSCGRGERPAGLGCCGLPTCWGEQVFQAA